MIPANVLDADYYCIGTTHHNHRSSQTSTGIITFIIFTVSAKTSKQISCKIFFYSCSTVTLSIIIRSFVFYSKIKTVNSLKSTVYHFYLRLDLLDPVFTSNATRSRANVFPFFVIARTSIRCRVQLAIVGGSFTTVVQPKTVAGKTPPRTHCHNQ